MTRVFQIGLLTEAFFNISGALLFVLRPAWCLSFALALPDEPVPSSAAVLFQVYGGLVLALTLPILLVVRESPGQSRAVFERRDIVFKTLAAGEVALIAILLWNTMKPAAKSGFSHSGLFISSVFLLPALTWHSFAVWGRPDLMRVDNEGKNIGRVKPS
ncbi:hypothetical protein PFICI_12753 [Pestalotiopsis fici W106-1]|uniref:Uncharacterized protein n=1 Tax=Pestalotiopsis fici (strain W106-1 / CGMCC3.15140) TaxID=1229662 RepID=W3WPU4_PESFW|nr:uncharacterized protein PFICI_12753 [Pestalotiopsis fici W106-1]ETS75809.1 hypothetical protein PFICI_12753 [Pestalotiopsis fici W106-1]